VAAARIVIKPAEVGAGQTGSPIAVLEAMSRAISVAGLEHPTVHFMIICTRGVRRQLLQMCQIQKHTVAGVNASSSSSSDAIFQITFLREDVNLFLVTPYIRVNNITI